MTKVQRLKLSREERSAINKINGLKSAAKRKLHGGFTHRGKNHPGIPNMPLKHPAMYTSDYIIFHRYAKMTGMLKLDLMHELVAPLKAKLGETGGKDSWSIALENEMNGRAEQQALEAEEY